MREITAERLSEVVSGIPEELPRVVASGNFATPNALLSVVDAALPAYRLFMLNAQSGIPTRDDVELETPFVGPGMRDQRNLRYLPARLSLVPALFARARPPDVVLLHTSLPRRGRVSLGIEVNILPAAIDAAKSRGALVVAQMNPNMPYTYGDGELHVDDIDYAVGVNESLASPGVIASAACTENIGRRVAELVPERATLQTGIGAIPNAALAALRKRRELRVWTEMFSDGVLELEKHGALDDNAPIVASFCFGSPELYGWLHENHRVRMERTERTNDPAVIARQPAMVSVNSALQVDLHAQANATRIGSRIYSGIGGQTDFVVGALHSAGGHAIIALPSWHPRAGVSTVVPRLDAPATSFQHSEIVTENGVAALFGCDHVQQAGRLIEYAAHPDARPALREAAASLGLLR